MSIHDQAHRRLVDELEQNLKETVQGEVRFDEATRVLYSTDASIYQIEPFGVVFPRSQDELSACIEISTRLGVPVLARGSGSSLAGQAIGPALILDCSRYLTNIVEVIPEEFNATVEPGVILDHLNRAVARYGLQFGPDPASSERATIGGVLANNATGAHSIRYGMAADHLLAIDTVLSNGSQARFEPVTEEQAQIKAAAGGQDKVLSREASIYLTALKIRENYRDAIYRKWPRTWRRASGYNLNYLLPWSPTRPPQWGSWLMGQEDIFDGAYLTPYPPIDEGRINLAPVLAGSEGTLAVIRQATVKLVPMEKERVLCVIGYPGSAEACDAVPGILESNPAAVELIPESMVRLAKAIPALAHHLGFVDQLSKGTDRTPTMLAVEFAGEIQSLLQEKVDRLVQGKNTTYVAWSRVEQLRVWSVRKAGLAILMSRSGDVKPVAFIEDLSVPVEHLGEFVREMERILTENGTEGDFYAHASAGCLHIRPLVNLKTQTGIMRMRRIAEEAVSVTIHLGGSVSGEHGDGLARSEWLEQMYGAEILSAFQMLKQAADPHDLLNPEKILNAPPMDANLRYGPSYQAKAWTPVMDFSVQFGLTGAVEQCNGAGVCRKQDGVMCPSFQASGEEMHSTRGRANLLRAMFSGRLTSSDVKNWQILYEALDLCLACKGCRAECPSGVDMAKVKYEFLQQYYQAVKRHFLRDYLFAYIDRLGRFGSLVPQLSNFVLDQVESRKLGETFLRISSTRQLPRLARHSLHSLEKRVKQDGRDHNAEETVIMLSDAFSEYFEPEVGLSAINMLRHAGYEVVLLPIIGAGRTLISKGFLKEAGQHAARLVNTLKTLDSRGEIPVIGLEPSEIYTLSDEYLDLFPGDQYVERLAGRAWMVDEFLIRGYEGKEPRYLRIVSNTSKNKITSTTIKLHGHCYQKAQPPAADGYPVGVEASSELLSAVGYRVEVIQSGCCGMAGAFGYEAEHYNLSLRVGELALFPEIRQAGESAVIAASGISCRAQIEDATGRKALHPIQLIERPN